MTMHADQWPVQAASVNTARDLQVASSEYRVRDGHQHVLQISLAYIDHFGCTTAARWLTVCRHQAKYSV